MKPRRCVSTSPFLHNLDQGGPVLALEQGHHLGGLSAGARPSAPCSAANFGACRNRPAGRLAGARMQEIMQHANAILLGYAPLRERDIREGIRRQAAALR